LWNKCKAQNILHFCRFVEIFRNNSLAVILESQYGSDTE
jgi:hypothetical protein